MPRLDTGLDLLIGHIGLVTLAPVLVAAAFGLLLRWRVRRVEAAIVAAVVTAFLLENARIVDPFGGFSPGPRFLIPVLPFLGVPLALASRRLPATTVTLTSISVALMAAVTITQPFLAHDGRWLERIENGSFGGHGIVPVPPFAILVLVAAGLAARTLPRSRVVLADATTAIAANGAWLALFLTVPGFVDGWDEFLGTAAALAVAGVLLANVRHLLVPRKPDLARPVPDAVA